MGEKNTITSTSTARPMITINDLIAGGAGGIIQVIVGQPFDIVKVRQQTGIVQNSYTKIIKEIIAK